MRDERPSAGVADDDAHAGRRPDAPRSDEERLDRARGLAWRQLNRRDRTVREVADHLASKDVPEPLIRTVLDELLQGGYLDDARFARRYAEDRRRLDSWGSERIARRLRTLDVAPEHVATALAAGAEDELDTALALLERRFPQPPDGERDRSRALGLLLRRGYDADTAYEALRRHRAA